MSEKRTVVVRAVEEKTGVSKKTGKPYTQYKLSDANGDVYSCFMADTVASVRDLAGQKADIEFEMNGNFKNLISAQPHDNGGGVPETYSNQKQGGETDWDMIGLRKTRCALWGAFLEGHLASSLYIKVSDKPDAIDGVLRAGQAFVVAAEKDVFERPPGDDGIPF